MIPELPSVVLSNGLIIANYSSPHPFTFTDGSVLGACSDKRATITSLESNETISFYTVRDIDLRDVKIEWKMTWFLKEELKQILEFIEKTPKKFPWDIILVPLPYLLIYKEWIHHEYHYSVIQPPFRVIRVADRITKEIHIDKFCI